MKRPANIEGFQHGDGFEWRRTNHLSRDASYLVHRRAGAHGYTIDVEVQDDALAVGCVSA